MDAPWPPTPQLLALGMIQRNKLDVQHVALITVLVTALLLQVPQAEAGHAIYGGPQAFDILDEHVDHRRVIGMLDGKISRLRPLAQAPIFIGRTLRGGAASIQLGESVR